MELIVLQLLLVINEVDVGNYIFTYKYIKLVHENNKSNLKNSTGGGSGGASKLN